MGGTIAPASRSAEIADTSARNPCSMKLSWKIRPASGLKLDLFANIGGVGWSALMQLACIPLYIKFMGIESYGLVGFFLMLQAMLQVLDMGLSPTINREMARYSVTPEKAGEARDLVRTLEVGYWIVGIAIGAAILIAAPSIAAHWIKAGSLPPRTVRQAVLIMGILSFLQWPISFYQGGLIGLGEQVRFNALRILQSTFASGGAVLVLWLFSPTILAFFLWQALASVTQVALVVILLWKSLPSADRPPRFDFSLVRIISGFAAGMSGIAVFSLILGQADKVIISKMFNLKIFGYYTVAGIGGTGLSMIVGSVFNTIYPRFSALAAAGSEDALRHLYHRCTQLMAVLILPVAAVLAMFSTEILQLWTRNEEVARNAGPIATVLVIGSAVNGLMYLPYALQLAYGWTSIGLRITIFMTVVVVPAIWLLASHYGPIGAAFVCVGLNAVNMMVGVPLTHRRILRGEAGRWFLQDIGPSLAAVVLVAGLSRLLITGQMAPLMTSIYLLAVVLCALAAAACLAVQVRGRLLSELSRIWLNYA